MNYTRVKVPQTPTAPKGIYIRCDAPLPEQNESVLKETALPKQTAENELRGIRGERRFRLGLPIRLTLVAAVGFMSFVSGCALGDGALCRVLLTLSAASGGRVMNDTPQVKETVYAQYADVPTTNVSAETESGGTDDLVYLESLPAESEAARQTDTSVIASSDTLYADGETLYPIAGRDLSCTDVHSLGNQTPLSPDTHALLAHTPSSLTKLSVPQDEPLVLIVHTHGTECYNEEGYTDYYRGSAPVRDEDITKNVVSMGTELEKVLTAFGIPVLHDTKMCDKDSFVKAYSVSYDEVTRLLAEHPSIRFVIDLHRDAIEGENGLRYKPVFDADGRQTAQLMFVVGTNAAGNAHPDWEENLSLALHIQNAANGRFPGLMRHINLRQASFNQQLSSGYMLLECGSCSNTHEEARRAIRLFGEALAQVIYEYAE